MYTFLFLLIVAIATFQQVYVLQAERFARQQTSLGKQMIAWHELAVVAARPIGTPVTNFCRLTPGAFLYADSAVTAATAGNCAATLGLPAGAAADYRFESVLYTVGGSNYVVTYVPPNAANAAAPRPPLGYQVGDYVSQLRRAAPPNAVNVGMIERDPVVPGQCRLFKPADNFAYPVTNCFIPAGSAAVFTII
jgi:hypothetical protein